MENTLDGTGARIKARDSAVRLMNRLTAGVAFAAIGGVGVFAAVSAHTVPGASSSTSTASSTAASTSTSSSSSSSAVQSSSTPVSSSPSSGVAVSGGS
jgi:hypothetical protein